ncbi:MAG: DNA polymerase III subunit beta [Patescibacteria group bacterium]|nr:DNA polymerase III subunit beta [Patescibacteria group bacterium]
MKISCTQENLNQGLNNVSHIASKNVSLPILNNVLLKAEKGTIKLTTTNLEIGINCQIRGKVEKEGEITVQAKLLNDYVNSLPNERVDLTAKDNKLNIECGKAHTVIKASSTEEFPLIPKVERKKGYEIKTSEIKKAITQVIFATATDESRPEISGVYLKPEKEEIILAATDSYRLAEKKIKKSEGPEGPAIIIPTRTLQELNRILTEDIESVNFYINENQILFTFDGIELVSRLIEGQYPDYKQIIPSDYKTKIVLSNQEFVKIIKTTSLFCQLGINDINLEIKDKKLIVSASNSQLGENTSSLAAKIEGEDNKIVFNYRYLLDGLSSIDSEEIILELSNNNNPGLIKPKEAKNYTYIIMPIRQ